MNTKLMNVISLDDGRIIKKGGGGGGVTINNQYKYIELTENGTTLITPDSGYTGLSEVEIDVAIPNEEKTIEITENGTTEVTAANGFLSKVVVNTNVASSGGGSDMPVIGDGKTYLYIKIAAKGRMDVPLHFSQTVDNGVTIDWGDGSETQTLSGTGRVNTTHTYAEIGEYTISLNPDSDCTLGLGNTSAGYGVMGNRNSYGQLYCNMLQACEIGKNVTDIGRAFDNCQSLARVVISEGVTSIGDYAFYYCYSLANVVIPSSVTVFDRYAFGSCHSLANVVIPDSVISINKFAFHECRGIAFFDFRASKSVPTLESASAFTDIPSDCKIVVPDDLYDTWIVATNWSIRASNIIKASEFNG